MQLNSPYVKSKTMKAPLMMLGDNPVLKAYLGDEEVYNRENAYDYDFYEINGLLISRGPLYYNSDYGYQIASTPYPSEMKQQMFKTRTITYPAYGNSQYATAEVGTCIDTTSGCSYAFNTPTSFEYGNYFFNYYELAKVFSSQGDAVVEGDYVNINEIDNQGTYRICCGGFDDWRLPTSADIQTIFLGITGLNPNYDPINGDSEQFTWRSGCTVNGVTGVKSMVPLVSVPRGTWWGTTGNTYMTGLLLFPDNHTITLSALGTKSTGYNAPFDNVGSTDCNLTLAQLTGLLSSGCTFIATSPLAGYFSNDMSSYVRSWPLDTSTMKSGNSYSSQYICLPASTLVVKNLGNGTVAFGGVYKGIMQLYANGGINGTDGYGRPQKTAQGFTVDIYELQQGVDAHDGMPYENQFLSARLVRNVNTNKKYNYISILQRLTTVSPYHTDTINDVGVDFDWDTAGSTNPFVYINGYKYNATWESESETQWTVTTKGGEFIINKTNNDITLG